MLLSCLHKSWLILVMGENIALKRLAGVKVKYLSGLIIKSWQMFTHYRNKLETG